MLRKSHDVFWAETMDGWQGMEVRKDLCWARKSCVHDIKKLYALVIVDE